MCKFLVYFSISAFAPILSVFPEKNLTGGGGGAAGPLAITGSYGYGGR